jgi:hypothetical protein
VIGQIRAGYGTARCHAGCSAGRSASPRPVNYGTTKARRAPAGSPQAPGMVTESSGTVSGEVRARGVENGPVVALGRGGRFLLQAGDDLCIRRQKPFGQADPVFGRHGTLGGGRRQREGCPAVATRAGTGCGNGDGGHRPRLLGCHCGESRGVARPWAKDDIIAATRRGSRGRGQYDHEEQQSHPRQPPTPTPPGVRSHIPSKRIPAIPVQRTSARRILKQRTLSMQEKNVGFRDRPCFLLGSLCLLLTHDR